MMVDYEGRLIRIVGFDVWMIVDYEVDYHAVYIDYDPPIITKGLKANRSRPKNPE